MQRRAQTDGTASPLTPGEIYLSLSRSLMRANEPVVGTIRAALNEIDPEAHTGKIPESVMNGELPRLIRGLALMDTLISDQIGGYRDLGDGAHLNPAAREGFDALADRGKELKQELENQGTHVDRLLSACRLSTSIEQNRIALMQNAIALRQNEAMKLGAILAAVATPPLLVVGAFGMNFESIPFDKPWLMIGSLAASVLVSAGLVAVGYAKGWLRPFRTPRLE